MSPQQFSQALLTEHLLMVSCQAYQSIDTIIEKIQSIESPQKKICLSLPYSSLHKHREQLSALPIWRGLSDIPSVNPQSFTEDVSIRLAKEANIDFAVIGGHTPRHVLYESNQSVAAKLRALLAADITPIVCFGETLQEHIRGDSMPIIQDQLKELLLGLTFDDASRVILVYKSPWINHIAPENFEEEYEKFQSIVLKAIQHLFGKDAISHIPILTDLPYITEDFSKISYDIPASGYFLELEGKNPQLIAEYFHLLAHTIPKAVSPLKPRKTPPIEAPVVEVEEAKPPAKKPGKSRKKKTVVEEHTEIESEEESIHESILSIDSDLEDPTIHFELQEPTEMLLEDAEQSTVEDFEFEWYSDDELDALRKEFGILPDGTKTPQSLPAWDNSRPVRIIKTQAQKAHKPAKSPKKTKSS